MTNVPFTLLTDTEMHAVSHRRYWASRCVLCQQNLHLSESVVLTLIVTGIPSSRDEGGFRSQALRFCGEPCKQTWVDGAVKEK